jgi:hypothetical protein
MRQRRRRSLAVLACTGVTLLSQLTPSPSAADHDDPAERTASLHLVTLRGPGAAGSMGPLPPTVQRARLLVEQDDVLAEVGDPAPLYRWTTALNGFAAVLTDEQAAELRALPEVALVERNAVRELARGATGTGGPASAGPRRGGQGTVIGIVDTGLAPDSPVFAQSRRAPRDGFAGPCQEGDGWPAEACTGKVAAARWFVAGFGRDAVRATTSLSPLDDDGHGTQMAALAAGNADVPVQVDGERLGRFGGQAPDARLAVYKACWSAPDPRDDGCATADLVTAIDRATADRVDVLSLSVGGPPAIDTVDRALLGAAEGGVLVVAAAGNHRGRPAAHAVPWVTTVGGALGAMPRGQVVGAGLRLTGAMLSPRGLGVRPVVLARDARAPGAAPLDAARCAPGSLDAGRVRGRIVVCERGGVGRVDKSGAVTLADGAGMVLLNLAPGPVAADVHAVPTVHLDRDAAQRLRTWLVGHPGARLRLDPAGLTRGGGVAPWSPSGDPDSGVVKPDVLAPATGLLAAVPGGWDAATGTSAAAAWTSGVAARLLARDGATPAAVRSALVTTAAPVDGGALNTGAGLVRPHRAERPGLVRLVTPMRYRRWLEDGGRLDATSVVLQGAATVARVTITNAGVRRTYFSSRAAGFRGRVLVTPAALRLGPGESATFTVRVLRRSRGPRVDDGVVAWRGARGTVTRIPVVLAR